MPFRFSAHANRLFVDQGQTEDIAPNGLVATPSRYASTKQVGWDEVSDARCLVLLGDPNIGKSREFAHQHEVLLKDHRRSFLTPWRLWSVGQDLLDVTEGVREAFDSSEEFTWFIDSLDEGRLESANAIGELIELLRAMNRAGIRAWLLRERIAPSEDFSSGLAERRRVAFDEICFRRTSKFSQFVDAPAVGAAACFPETSLRKRSRSYHSYHEELLRVLLFSSIPWRDGAHHLKAFDANPSFASKALTEVGDTYDGFYNCVRMAAGIARNVSVPRVLIAMRDAIARAPADLFNDFDCQWYVETICRVAVHDHRQTVLSDARLRQATLDVLDVLVDAGSSLAFQLRDYLATSPAIDQDASPYQEDKSGYGLLSP